MSVTAVAIATAAIALLEQLPAWTEAAENLYRVLKGSDLSAEDILDLEHARDAAVNRQQERLKALREGRKQ
jgi:hypothetical protein